MRQKLTTRKAMAWLVAALFIALAVPALAWAAEPIDVNKDVSLDIDYKYETQALAGVEFQLHKVGTVDASGVVTPANPYAAYPVDFNAATFEELQKSAKALEGYVLRDGHAALAKQTTDAAGRLVFNTDGANPLKPGLYLVMGTTHTQGGFTYHSSPLLIILPDASSAQGILNYNPVVNPKVEQVPAGSSISCKVLKIWNDAGKENQRPSQISVDLLCDGVVHDTVLLNEKNSWRHIWDNLDVSKSWNVVEHEVGGYIVSVEKTNNTFSLTNSVKPTTPDPGKPDPSDPNDPTDPNDPYNPYNPNNPSGDGGKPSSSSGKPAPQTGLLWWPVPVLFIGGVCFLLVGVARGRREGYAQK